MTSTDRAALIAPITCTLRTLDASGNEVTRLIQIEPIGDGTGDWRVVPEDRRARIQSRYDDKRKRREARNATANKEN